MSDDDVTVRFPESGLSDASLPVVLEGDHVLTLGIVASSKLASITVHQTSRRLGAAAALGKPAAYHFVKDAEKDALVVEFREGAAERSATLDGKDVAIDGERFLRLLYGTAKELEGIIICNASRWLSI